MQILTARDLGPAGYAYRVHLDPTKVLPDGTPDPAYVAEYTWGKAPGDPRQTAADYQAQIERELELLCAAELAARNAAGTPLPAEGKPLRVEAPLLPLGGM